MKKLLFILIIFTTSIAATANADERDAVIQVIVDFFDAMTARDVEAMRSLMTPDGVLYGYRETVDGLQVTSRTHSEYLEGLGNGEATLVERFWDPEVVVSGRMATALTPYDFHIDGNFSHCGVNSFSMLRTDTGWVITGVVYSMATEGCEDSPLGPIPPGDDE